MFFCEKLGAQRLSPDLRDGIKALVAFDPAMAGDAVRGVVSGAALRRCLIELIRITWRLDHLRRPDR